MTISQHPASLRRIAISELVHGQPRRRATALPPHPQPGVPSSTTLPSTAQARQRATLLEVRPERTPGRAAAERRPWMSTSIAPSDTSSSSPAPEPAPSRPASSTTNASSHGRAQPRGARCRECGQIFASRALLRRHQGLTHGRARPFSCNVCGAGFLARTHLRAHQATVHERRTPFKCQHCDARFGLKWNRDNHVRRVHERARPFQCGSCEARFAQRWDRDRHLRLIHDEGPLRDLRK